MAGRLCDAAVREFYGERLPKKYLEFLQTPVMKDGNNQAAENCCLPSDNCRL
jgi:hypothetical protein